MVKQSCLYGKIVYIIVWLRLRAYWVQLWNTLKNNVYIKPKYVHFFKIRVKLKIKRLKDRRHCAGFSTAFLVLLSLVSILTTFPLFNIHPLSLLLSPQVSQHFSCRNQSFPVIPPLFFDELVYFSRHSPLSLHTHTLTHIFHMVICLSHLSL